MNKPMIIKKKSPIDTLRAIVRGTSITITKKQMNFSSIRSAACRLNHKGSQYDCRIINSGMQVTRLK